MANNRPLRPWTKWNRQVRAGKRLRKIPWSRMAHKRDRLPGFITNACSPSGGIPVPEAACPAFLLVDRGPTNCRLTASFDLVTRAMVQARQDNITLTGLHGEFWWYANPTGLDCSTADVTAWSVWSLIRYDESVDPAGGTDTAVIYNPWDTGPDLSGTGAEGEVSAAFGFSEGDFTDPRGCRIAWQKHQVQEAQGYCEADNGSASPADVALTFSQWPASNVDGTLVDGTGTINTADCIDCGPVDLTGTITPHGVASQGAQGVMATKSSHMRINIRKRVPLVKNQRLVLQVDFGDPYHDCQGTDPLGWNVQMWGYLRPTIELA